MHTPWISRAAAALLALATVARAESNICSWATFDDPTADSPSVPTAAWGISPPCVSTEALYRTARLDITNGSAGIATNVEVVIHVDDRLIMVDAFSTPRNGSVHWADATFDPVVVRLPLMPTNQTVQVTLRVRARSWKPHGGTPQNEWAWDETAWPACEHVGGREIIPGILYKQIWARDLYWALEERCQGVHSNGSEYVFNTLNPAYNPTTKANSVRPSWWTESGVTNRVVRYDGASQDVADTQSPSVTFLETAKRLTALLAPYYLNTELVDPDSFEDAWPDFHRSCGGMIDYPVTNFAFTAWYWDCPSVEHSVSWDVLDQREIGTNTYRWTAHSLPAALALPSRLFSITPYRFLEGLCDPSSGGSQWIFRDTTVTQVCNWATYGSVTSEAGPVPTASWHTAPQCIDQGSAVATVTLRLTNGGTTIATNVTVAVTVNSELELVDASCATGGGAVQWASAPVMPVAARLTTLAPGAVATVTIRARLRRDQGPATTYWGDFGWDALRSAIRAIDTMHVGVPGWSAYGHIDAPVYASWEWPEEEGDNQVAAFAINERTYYVTNALPGTVVEEGDWNGAKDAADDDLFESYSSSAAPYFLYRGNFRANPTPPEGETNVYSCVWWVQAHGAKNYPAIKFRRQWPPSNVVMAVSYFADTYTGEEVQQGYPTVPQRETEVLGAHTFSAPTTNTHVFATAYGQNSIDPAFWPADPSAAQAWPSTLDSIYEYGSPEFLAERHPNFTLNAKSWENAHLLLRYTWSLP